MSSTLTSAQLTSSAICDRATQFGKCARVFRRKSGWLVTYRVMGIRYSRYFSDIVFGSRENAASAAKVLASLDADVQNELLILQRRFAVRATSRSGVPGVSRYEGNSERGPVWMAYYADPKTGRKRSKRFSIKKFGEELARDLAISWRQEAVTEIHARFLEISSRKVKIDL